MSDHFSADFVSGCLGVAVIVAIFALVIWRGFMEAREEKRHRLNEELRRRAQREQAR